MYPTVCFQPICFFHLNIQAQITTLESDLNFRKVNHSGDWITTKNKEGKIME